MRADRTVITWIYFFVAFHSMIRFPSITGFCVGRSRSTSRCVSNGALRRGNTSLLGTTIATENSSSSSFSSRDESDSFEEGFVTVLDRGKHHLVVSKTPGVVCHHSEWTGSRKNREAPMLQRVRDAIGHRVNLIHRLDRGCSGCLLMTFAQKQNNETDDDTSPLSLIASDATKELIDAMKLSESKKTYLALVRGEGILYGEDLKEKGWFLVDRPIKDERGELNSARTWFKFIAGQDNQQGTIDRPRASIVLARPETGRWHQIRRHLNGLSHPILGDSTHGNSKTNQEYRKRYSLPPERTCLHLARLQLKTSNPEYSSQSTNIDIECSNDSSKVGIIDVTCPLENDMWNMLQNHLPDLWARAVPELEALGIFIEPQVDATQESAGEVKSSATLPLRLPFRVAI